ncbi:MAG: hypothetical protein ACRC8U_01695, partial [Brooklawnia sp.]
LVMPVEGALKTMLIEHAEPDEYIERTFSRDDAEQESSALPRTEWSRLLNDGNWVMAVPILTKYVKAAIPRYLTAATWYRTKYKRGGRSLREELPSRPSPFPGMTYLQTPTENIRPICVMCPRFILHQNGECSPGQKICFDDNLTVGMADYFKEGLDMPLPSPNINEPEIEKVIEDADVSKD